MKIIRKSKQSKIVIDGGSTLVVSRDNSPCLDLKTGKHRPIWITNFSFVSSYPNNLLDKIRTMRCVWRFLNTGNIIKS